MTELERGLGTRWFEEVWNKGNRAAIAEMLAPDAVLHEGGTDSVGPEGFHAFYDRLNASFSDFQVTVHKRHRWRATVPASAGPAPASILATHWAFLPPTRPFI